MNITHRTQRFVTEFKILFPPRRLIVLDLIERLESASNLDDLMNLVPCNLNQNDHFIFNNVCKLYFEYFPDTNQIGLLDFTFANHDF